MAEISFKGLDEFALSLKEVAELPDAVVDAMLNAGADVAVDAQRAEALKLGKFDGYRNKGQTRDWSTGETARSIKKGKIKTKNGTRVIYVTPTGARKRGKTVTRNAEIAFLNEYGTKTIRARNFLRTANEKCAKQHVAAQAEVYNRWLESKNL